MIGSRISVKLESEVDCRAETVLIMSFVSGRVLSDLNLLSRCRQESVRAMMDTCGFGGRLGEWERLYHMDSDIAASTLLLGLGSVSGFKDDRTRRELGRTLRSMSHRHTSGLNRELIVPMLTDRDTLEMVMPVLIETMLLSEYSYSFSQSNDSSHNSALIILVVKDELHDFATGLLARIEQICSAVMLARDLTNEPSNTLTPTSLAAKVTELFHNTSCEVSVLDEVEIMEAGMTGYHSVSQGSSNPARFIIMRYRGESESMRVIGVVGKGVTYDSGGLSLKSKDRLLTMHHDMAGAAAVIGVMKVIVSRGLKVNVVAAIPACENMLSPTSYRPGDVIRMMSGKTVQITSTDAEGRLTLADSVHYLISREEVTEVVDIASLTGGARAALGDVASLVLTNCERMSVHIHNASHCSGEKVWRMPMFPEYLENLRSNVADLLNSSKGDGAKGILGGLFINQFTGGLPWLHIDIAATCWSSAPSGYHSVGATGVGVRLLHGYFTRLASEDNDAVVCSANCYHQ